MVFPEDSGNKKHEIFRKNHSLKMINLKLFAKLILLFFPTVLFAQDWQMKQAKLMTSFSQDIDPGNVLPEYPRPQLERKLWMNLNGIWQFQPGLGILESVPQGNLSHSILVPFAVESAISGIKEHHSRLWYRRTFSVPENWNEKQIIIHFGAVDYESEVYINGTSLGIHKGGYDAFSYNISNYLTASGEQEITVRVFDPTDSGGYPRGKQTLYPGGIMYTSVTGIWQSVWLEPVSETYIQNIKIVPDINQKVVKLTLNTSGITEGTSFSASIYNENKLVQNYDGVCNQEITIPIPNQKLWSPDDPFLYNLELVLKQNGTPIDSVSSYFGMRKISVEEDGGFKKLFLNNQFLFQMGPLDQGFWPDGIYTAPTDEALRYDIQKMKDFGFNMVRKHIKVEPQRWYYWADKLGLMVWQDMPSANSYTNNPQIVDQFAYDRELGHMVEQHWNSPSIVMWVVFNEAQGQHRTPELVQKVINMDPTRIVNQASGGNHFNVGHVMDIHSYPPPACPKSSTQVLACGEYGGVGYKIPGHLWNDGFGYVMANNEEEYLDLYDSYADMLTMFKTNNGLSAAVYTEITDVEIEINGLLTYDRLVKADENRIKEANKKVIEHDIYFSEVIASSENTAHLWKYTNYTPSSNWHLPSYDDSNWKSGNAGFGTMGTPGAVVRTIWNTSDIWMRRDEFVGDLSGINTDNLILHIHYDEDCEVYINGVLAAATKGWTNSYTNIPINTAGKNALKSNDTNIIAIHCKQTTGGQYIDAGISLFSMDVPAPEITTSANQQINNGSIYVYPNPSIDSIFFSIPYKTNVMATIINANGAEVKTIEGTLSSINVSELIPGIYLLKVIEGLNTHTFKFAKK